MDRRVALPLVLLVSACIHVYQSIRPRPLDLHTPVTVTTPVKVHLVDGSTVVFLAGVTVDSAVVRGDGNRYSLTLRDSAAVTSIPLDSIVGMEAFEQSVNGASSFVVSVLATSGMAGVVAVLAVAIFGSCPTVYADSAGTALLQAEGFSYSIAPIFESRDVDRLRLVQAADGSVRLEVRNEALETHYLNQLELLEVVHGSAETALVDERNGLVVLADQQSLTRAIARLGRERSEAGRTRARGCPVVPTADGDERGSGRRARVSRGRPPQGYGTDRVEGRRHRRAGRDPGHRTRAAQLPDGQLAHRSRCCGGSLPPCQPDRHPAGGSPGRGDIRPHGTGKHARRRRPVPADITRPAIHRRLSSTELGRAAHVFPGGSGLLHGVGPGELAPEPARRSWLRAVRFGAGAGVGPLADVAGFARGAVYRHPHPHALRCPCVHTSLLPAPSCWRRAITDRASTRSTLYAGRLVSTPISGLRSSA